MTNEEFQKLVLEKLTGLEKGQTKLEKRVDEVESTLTIRVDEVESTLTKRIDKVESALTKRIDEVESTLTAKVDALDTKVERYGQSQQDDVKALLELMDKKLDRISENQIIQGESINILALRQLQTESELAAFKKAL
ncbi:hypothetical protein Desde_3535 [Desulfitobacterium dehalogenans ATCC 51507]|uniref:Uncharacterized protein n=1 Tax=Desulfitobacterium dehalogenans (strain ATCC 51507 / DSM 9161 / JW/IU-DC1) TaxID=756499 RepID=I4ACY2_DESDJ|nr:hypothetical protein [Desulfitobacterium dehalogenans]AFM01817.1 hypothetical protein Desde_3535 [Desulfitobacterium dehalogenans ATCC 51507]